MLRTVLVLAYALCASAFVAQAPLRSAAVRPRAESPQAVLDLPLSLIAEVVDVRRVVSISRPLGPTLFCFYSSTLFSPTGRR